MANEQSWLNLLSVLWTQDLGQVNKWLEKTGLLSPDLLSHIWSVRKGIIELSCHH